MRPTVYNWNGRTYFIIIFINIITNPKNIDNPRIYIFLNEFKFMNCRLDSAVQTTKINKIINLIHYNKH